MHFKTISRDMKPVIALTALAMMLMAMMVSVSHAAQMDCDTGWVNGWIQNVSTPESTHINGSCDNLGLGFQSFWLSTGEDSGKYIDDTDNYRYYNGDWTVSHGFQTWKVSGWQPMDGMGAAYANWCNKDTSVSTILKIRCDW